MSDLEPLKEHFRRQIDQYDDPARACSWRDADVARRNFAAVSQLFAHETNPFSVYEVGCGFATLGEFLSEHYPLATYSGSDLLPEMIDRAKARNTAANVEQRDILVNPPVQQYDYVVISGLFNLRMSNDDESWFTFVKSMLRAAFGIAKKGRASSRGLARSATPTIPGSLRCSFTTSRSRSRSPRRRANGPPNRKNTAAARSDLL